MKINRVVFNFCKTFKIIRFPAEFNLKIIRKHAYKMYIGLNEFEFLHFHKIIEDDVIYEYNKFFYFFIELESTTVEIID